MNKDKVILYVLILSIILSVASLMISAYTYYSFSNIQDKLSTQLDNIHETLEDIGESLHAGINDNG